MQTLPAASVDELRIRLDADPAWAADAQLQDALDVALQVVGSELDPDGDYTAAANVEEAVYQIAVKVWDLRARGVQSISMDGSPDTPAMPATSGLVRAVRGLLLPSMPDGGVTV